MDKDKENAGVEKNVSNTSISDSAQIINDDNETIPYQGPIARCLSYATLPLSKGSQ